MAHTCGSSAEESITKGHIVLVPGVTDEKSTNIMDEWKNSNPKQYKIKVLHRTAKKIDLPCLVRSNMAGRSL